MRKKSVLAVFLILILLLSGCSHSRQAAVSDAPVGKGLSQSNSTSQKQTDNETAHPIQPASVDKGKSAASEPESEGGRAGEAEPRRGESRAHLLVTRDYGEAVIFNQWVAVQDQQDALSLTESYLDVKTSYGGSFINSINGLTSGYTGKMALNRTKQDWFFYINGILAGSGAGDVKLSDGDVIWWDYHDWGSAAFTPAMIGAFPHPFTNGVLLAYSPSAKDASGLLAASLGSRGIKTVQLREVNNEVIKTRPQPVILLGLREEIAALPAIQALNSNPHRTGLFCGFSDSGFKLLNAAMQEGQAVAQGGCVCVQATASGMGDANPLWLMVAEDEKGLERAVAFLNQGSINPDYGWGVMLDPQGVTPLPLR
ncbi:DUF4430 domain-containing protein [Syntrophomonas curvata]